MLLKNLKLVKGSQSLSVNLSDIKTNRQETPTVLAWARGRDPPREAAPLQGRASFLPSAPQVWVEKVRAGYYAATGF